VRRRRAAGFSNAEPAHYNRVVRLPQFASAPATAAAAFAAAAASTTIIAFAGHPPPPAKPQLRGNAPHHAWNEAHHLVHPAAVASAMACCIARMLVVMALDNYRTAITTSGRCNSDPSRIF
jgi:hypothetical protein